MGCHVTQETHIITMMIHPVLLNAGGCDYIQDIKCEAVNLEAAKAYARVSSTEKYANALSCIESRCNINFSRMQTVRTFSFVAILGVLSVGILAFVYYQKKSSQSIAVLDVKSTNFTRLT